MSHKYKYRIEQAMDYPIYLDVENDVDTETGELLLNASEARGIIDALTAALADLESSLNYVRVRFPGGGQAYTYLDPSGTVKLNDNVVVETTYGEAEAEVVALGRGNWTGPVKQVVAVMRRVDL